MSKYLLGFNLLSTLKNNGINWQPLAASINVAKGEVIFDNGSGYATNVGTAFAATFLGIAAADANNGSGSAGDLSVPIIPPDFYEWLVPNESATVAAQTDIGEIIDLDSNDGVDVTDTTCVAYGFRVEGIDISTAAIAAAAGGFVRGKIITMDQD